MSNSKGNSIVLLSCVKKKKDTPNAPVRAGELYISPLFEKSLRYAKEVLKVGEDRIFILSAEHHLLPLHKRILKYEKTLNNASVKEREVWADKVWHQLSAKFPAHTKYIILAGRKYYEKLIGVDRISNFEIPLEGLTQGKRLQALNKAIECKNKIKR